MPAMEESKAPAAPAYNLVISWSRTRSEQAALAFRIWLPRVLQAAKPWMSSTDIAKGTAWAGDLKEQLDARTVGVVFLTPDNLDSPWILFEAGALSKTVKSSSTRVMTILLDGLTPTDLNGPLSLFQHTYPTEQDMKTMVLDLAKAIEAPIQKEDLAAVFDGLWPKIKDVLAPQTSTTPIRKQRPDRELLEEGGVARAQEERRRPHEPPHHRQPLLRSRHDQGR